MSRFTKKAFQPLDQEEKDLMESIEKEEWQLLHSPCLMRTTVYYRLVVDFRLRLSSVYGI